MSPSPARRVVVVGGSAGGLEPLKELVGQLPADLPAAVLAVIHFPPAGRTRLAHILDRSGDLPVSVAHDGEPLQEGRIYVPAPDRHMVLSRGRIRLSHAPRENGVRPAIDPLMRSAARHYGEAAIGVVLCGMLDDGSAGLLTLRRAGGATVVLDPAGCPFPDMPRNAIALADPEHVVGLAELGLTIVELARRPLQRSVVELAGVGRIESQPGRDEEAVAMARPEHELWGDDRSGRPSGFSCPECHGVLWEVEQPGDIPRFECRVGHRVSAETLLELRVDEIEGALWASVRALEEQVALARRLCDRAIERDDRYTAERFRRRAEEAGRQADVVRALALQPRIDSDPAVEADAAAES